MEVLEMTVHLIFCILVTSNKSLDPAHTRMEEIIQRCEDYEAEAIGSHFRSCLPHYLSEVVEFAWPLLSLGFPRFKLRKISTLHT